MREGKSVFGDGVRIATTSDTGHWFRNDRVFARSAVQGRRADRVVRPYGGVTRNLVERGVGDAAPYESVSCGA